MDWRLFLSTFALIFLAELGDKTQLAAMARTASSSAGKWTVFWAASSALVCSTLIAVLVGAALSRLVPPKTIKLVAGALFILFGLLILKSAFAPAAAARREGAAVGPLTRTVLKIAADFEAASSLDYRALAARTVDARLAELFRSLAGEEDNHLRRIREAHLGYADLRMTGQTAALAGGAPDLRPDVARKTDPVLRHAIEHEAATAAFYSELAELTPLPALRDIFNELAAAEREHAARLLRVDFADRAAV
jgi:rubrerythrin